MHSICHLKPLKYTSLQSTVIEDLPIELLTEIFNFLHLKELAPLNTLNKNFNTNIRLIENQKVWLTSKFKETLHIKFQNDPREQSVKCFEADLIFKNVGNTRTEINVPSNKSKTKFAKEIITLPNNACPSTCQEANELVKKIFSSFIGYTTYKMHCMCKETWHFKKTLNSAIRFTRSEDEVFDILYMSLIFLEETLGKIGFWGERGGISLWLEYYCDGPFTNSSFTKKIFNFAAMSKNIQKTKILCLSLSKNAELLDEAYRIAYQIFEYNYNNKLLIQCIKTNPKLALEVFEKYKTKTPIWKTDKKFHGKPILDLLAACVEACPEELSKEGFEIAKKKFGKSKVLYFDALALLLTCIKANPQQGQEAFDLVRSREDVVSLPVLCAWVSVDSINACPVVYEYLERSNLSIDEDTRELIKICIDNSSCIPNFFERTELILERMKCNVSFYKETLICCLVADRELAPKILKSLQMGFGQGLPRKMKDDILNACISSYKRKHEEEEVLKNKKVKENELEIDKQESLDPDGFPMNFFNY